MRYILLFVWTFLLSTTLLGQANDCASATTICANPPPSGNPQGNGGYDDFSDPDNDPGCLSSEGNTAWFYFEIEAGAPPGLTLEFSIIPDGGYGEDYDWALFGPDVDCGDLGSPIRCSSASFNCAFCPETGLGMGATDYSEFPVFGDGFVAPLLVNGGEGYFIAINNWYGTGNGFTMTFGGDAAQFFDCTATPPCTVKAIASEDEIVCEGGVPVQIHVTPDGGLPAYMYSWAGTGNGSDFLSDPTARDPIIAIPLGINGSFTYSVTVTDGICEAVDSLLITVVPHSPLLIDFLIGLDLDGQPTILSPKISQGQPPYSFLWSDGSMAPTRSDLSPGIYQLTVTDGLGCSRAEEFKYGIPGGGVIGNGGLQIEPVPGGVIARFDAGINPMIHRYQVVDLLGRTIVDHSGQIHPSVPFFIPLPCSGIYVLKAVDRPGTEWTRLFSFP